MLRMNVWVFEVCIARRLTPIYLLHIFHSSVDRLDGKKDSICLPVTTTANENNKKKKEFIFIRYFVHLTNL